MFCETVVLLSKGMVDSRKVKVDFSLEDMDLSEFKGKIANLITFLYKAKSLFNHFNTCALLGGVFT